MAKNFAAIAVEASILFAGYGGVQWDVVLSGLDINARHFYRKHDNSWRGTRFSDGSAVTAIAGGLPVEFLGSFAKAE